MSARSLLTFQAPPNTRMQPTAFGARDRCYFGAIPCGAPRLRLMRKTLGGSPLCAVSYYSLRFSLPNHHPVMHVSNKSVMNTISVALIWNEEHDLILMVQLLCRERGYVFQHFRGFAGVQEHWQHHPPSVAIIKRSLDTIDDGLAFCRTIRADYQLHHLPLIIGWADMPRQPFEEAYEAGANGCFGRVFDIGGVFTMVERLAQDPTQTQLVDQLVPHRKRI